MGSTEKFCLRWNDFETNISSAFHDLKEEKDFSDVTLVCADQQVEAHRVILAASSPFFKKVLRKVQHSHPLIYMKGVKFSDMEAVLSFVYHGEVNVAEEDLNSFLAVAEELEVKGLTCGKNSSEGNSNHLPHPHSNELQSNSNHEFPSNSIDQFQKKQSNHLHQPSAPAPPRSSAQVHLQTSFHGQTEQKWSSSENNNSDENVNIKRELGSSQLVNTSQVPVEEVDQYAGYEVFRKGEEFDLNNHIEKISKGANIGKFKCNICGHVNSRMFNVKTHVENTHFPGMVEYSCGQCERKFNSRSKYYNHRSLHHSNKKSNVD